MNGTAPTDDDIPLDADEEVAGAAAAAQQVTETLDERVRTVADSLADLEQRSTRDGLELAAHGRAFAVIGGGRLDVALEPPVLKAALGTPDTHASFRGPSWISFAPQRIDRYALDRAEAWLRLAHRVATGG